MCLKATSICENDEKSSKQITSCNDRISTRGRNEKSPALQRGLMNTGCGFVIKIHSICADCLLFMQNPQKRAFSRQSTTEAALREAQNIFRQMASGIHIGLAALDQQAAQAAFQNQFHLFSHHGGIVDFQLGK